MSRLLINEPPLLVLPLLAKTIGLNEAILLQQIHYWLKRSKHEAGGERWVYNTYADWLEQLPFWSEKTLRRIVKKLEDSGILISTYEFNPSINKTKWYRIDYTKLNALIGTPSKTELIIDDYPLMFQPSLAVNYGLNEAIFLQQLHYWLKYSNKEIDGHLWVVNKYQSWLDQFTFWSLDILKRTIKSLTDKQLILNTNKYNDSAILNLRWLTINYSRFILQTDSDQTLAGSDQTLAGSDQTLVGSDQTLAGSDQTLAGSDQTLVGSDQTLVGSDQTLAGSDQTLAGSDQTLVGSDQTLVGSDQIASGFCPDSQRILTSPHYNIDYNTETITKTERKTGENQITTNESLTSATKNAVQVLNVNGLSNNVDSSETKNTPLTQEKDASNTTPFGTTKSLTRDEIIAYYDIAFNCYKQLINENAIKKPTASIEKQIQEGVNKHGNSVIEKIFENVKKSDFLLGFKSFNVKLSWIIKNADNIISGKYENEDCKSLYELAHECCSSNQVCSVISANAAPLQKCKFCNKYHGKQNKIGIVEKSPQQQAEECSIKGFCPMERFNLKHLKSSSACFVCKFGPKSEETSDTAVEADLQAQAKKCYEKCKGMCSHRIMKTPALEYCIFCPGTVDTTPNRKKQKSSKNQNQLEQLCKKTKDIIVNYKNSDEVWIAAYEFINNIHEHRKITKLIEEVAVFSVYSVSDLHAESLIIAYDTLMEFAATDQHIALSKLQSHFYMNLKNFLIRKCANIPSLRDVLKTENKSACSFIDISEIENVLNTEINSNEEHEPDTDLITNSDETIRIFLGILSSKEEQVFRYRFGLTQRGKLTQKECADIFNCTDKNVLRIEKEAINKIKEFIENEKINKDTPISLLKEKVIQYQKKLESIKFDGYFELGNLSNVI